mgnify:FL=1
MTTFNKITLNNDRTTKNKLNGFNLLELLIFLFLFSLFLPFITNFYVTIATSISAITKQMGNSFEIAHINQTIETDSSNCEDVIELSSSKYQLILKNNKKITYELKNYRLKRTENNYGYYISHAIIIDSFNVSTFIKDNLKYLKLTINTTNPSYFKLNT